MGRVRPILTWSYYKPQFVALLISTEQSSLKTSTSITCDDLKSVLSRPLCYCVRLGMGSLGTCIVISIVDNLA